MTEVAIEDLPVEMQKKAKAAERDVPQIVDYFATTDVVTHVLPDGVQSVDIKVLNEGERRSYLNKTNSEVVMNARTRDLKMRSQAGDDLHHLLETAIVGWNVFQGGAVLTFTRPNLVNALNAWPPVLIDDIAKKVREANPWLLGTEDDLDALREERDEIDKRITELEKKAAKS